jgi:hypothetical protein
VTEEKKDREDRNVNNLLEANALEIRIADASAWIKKYLREASEFRGDLSDIITARRASKLISSPIHAINQEEADIAIREPARIIPQKRNFHGSKIIKRRISP